MRNDLTDTISNALQIKPADITNIPIREIRRPLPILFMLHRDVCKFVPSALAPPDVLLSLTHQRDDLVRYTTVGVSGFYLLPFVKHDRSAQAPDGQQQR